MIDAIQLAQNIRHILAGQPSVSEKRMFGGFVFMVGGHIVCGSFGGGLLVRVGTEEYEAALKEQYVQAFQMGKRQSKGWVVVGRQALTSIDDVAPWVQRGLATISTLGAK